MAPALQVTLIAVYLTALIAQELYNGWWIRPAAPMCIASVIAAVLKCPASKRLLEAYGTTANGYAGSCEVIG